MPASINNNLMAANVANNLNSHYGKLAISVERLSSALRINSAADDAAGLAIRELMRADVAALNQGVRNANDAISMLQVADGALGIIDEKLVRMKELAEQAATGTYNSTQRLMIHSEFVAMGEEIDRIARATDFNGIKLLDGSLSGQHNGNGLNATGAMKIHFGTANDSAEDYYYIEISDCTLAGLNLINKKSPQQSVDNNFSIWEDNFESSGITRPPLNDYLYSTSVEMGSSIDTINNMLPKQGDWYFTSHTLPPFGQEVSEQNFMFIIPKGTKNVVINCHGVEQGRNSGDNDIQIFTKNGIHLVGTPLDDYSFNQTKNPLDPGGRGTSINENSFLLGFDQNDYVDDYLNRGPSMYIPDYSKMSFSIYNGMTIGYSGDPDRYDAIQNNGATETWADYEVITIDTVTEDLIFWYPGNAGGTIKAYYDTPTSPRSYLTINRKNIIEIAT